MLGSSGNAFAADFVVTTTADDGPGSLRQAVAEANTNGEADTIEFASELAGQTVAMTTSDPASTALSGPNVTGPTALVIEADGGNPLTIQGDPTQGIILDAGGARRLFTIDPGASLVLEHLTLQGGVAQGGRGGDASNTGGQVAGGGGDAAGLGGAVFVNAGTLTLQRCLLHGHQAQGGRGGSVDPSHFSATGHRGSGGGGLGGDGEAASVNSAASPIGGAPNGGNRFDAGNFGGGAGEGAAGGFGGGAGGNAGALNFTGGFGAGGAGGAANAIMSWAGSAGGFGAGAGAAGQTGGDGGSGGGGAGLGGAVFNNGGAVVATDCTFSNNRATGGDHGAVVGGPAGTQGLGHGGALFSRNGTVSLTGCTFASNTAVDGKNNETAGASVFILSDRGGQQAQLTIFNTILADGTGTEEAHSASTNFGTPPSISGGSNVIESSTASYAGTIGSTTDPGLGTLADNGGPTQTHALPSGIVSSAKGTGDPALCGSLDQRRWPRCVGNCDVGAYEVQPDLLVVASGGGQTAELTATFATPITIMATEGGTPVQGAPISFSFPSSGASATVSPVTQATDTAGQATVTATANDVSGTYNINASVGGASTLVDLTNANANVIIVSGDDQRAIVGNAFSMALQVQVETLGRTPIPGVEVTFAGPTDGAGATFPEGAAVVTDANGQAQVSVSANSQAGSYLVTVDAGGNEASFALTNDPSPDPPIGGGGMGGQGGDGDGDGDGSGDGDGDGDASGDGDGGSSGDGDGDMPTSGPDMRSGSSAGGCGCRLSRSTDLSAIWLLCLTVVFGAFRRRRLRFHQR